MIYKKSSYKKYTSLFIKKCENDSKIFIKLSILCYRH